MKITREQAEYLAYNPQDTGGFGFVKKQFHETTRWGTRWLVVLEEVRSPGNCWGFFWEEVGGDGDPDAYNEEDPVELMKVAGFPSVEWKIQLSEDGV